MWVLYSVGGGEGQALLLRRNGAGNVLERVVGFYCNGIQNVDMWTSTHTRSMLRCLN